MVYVLRSYYLGPNCQFSEKKRDLLNESLDICRRWFINDYIKHTYTHSSDSIQSTLTGLILFFFFGSMKWSDAAVGAEVTSVGGFAVDWEGASSLGGGATGGSDWTAV